MPKGNQTYISLPLRAELLARVDEARGGEARSLWIRKAMVEKLSALGMETPPVWAYPPPPVQRMGRPPKARPPEEVRKVAEEAAEYGKRGDAERDADIVGWMVDLDGKARPVRRSESESDEEKAG